jgi:carbon-monoxide dehydrogenase large subunit
MKEYSVIGKAVKNIDGIEITTGDAVFIDDIKLTGMLYGKILRSQYPHARILNIDVGKAKRLPGVAAVVTGKDVAGYPRYGLLMKDRPIFALDKVHYLGDSVAGVVAVDMDTAEEACSLIRVDYEELPAVFNQIEAMQEGAPLVHENLQEYECASSLRPVPNSNICAYFKLRQGDVEEGFKQADYIFEDELRTQPMSPSPIETVGCIASVDGRGNITVWSNTQMPYGLTDVITECLGIPANKVRVIVPHIGGGFGLKMIPKGELVCILMSQFAGKPVKLVFTREEDLTATTVRQPLITRVKTGVNRDGTIVARKCTLIWNTGAYADMGPRVSVRGATGGGGPYKIPHLWVDSYCVYTNNTVGGAIRGFGLSETTWAIESHMDMIAEKLNLDPLEFRWKNVLEEGVPTPTGQVAHAVGLKECLQSIKETWKKKSGERKNYSSVGISCFHKGTGTPSSSSAFIKINAEATVSVLTSSVEIGQGCRTVFAQIVAEELGLPVEKINVTMPDTFTTPYDSGTAGSRTTFIGGKAVKLAAQDARREILNIASQVMGIEADRLELKDGRVMVKGSSEGGVPLVELPMGGNYISGGEVTIGYPVIGKGYFSTSREGSAMDLETGQGSRSSAFWMYGCNLVEIELDPDTGQIKVKRVIAAHNVGKAINPSMLVGQYEGGILMALGDALCEKLTWHKGETLNPSYRDYKIPTFEEIPEEIKSVIIEIPHEDSAYGNIGLGEAAMIGLPAAIGNALYNAVGVRIEELPITPEKVLHALKEKQSKANGKSGKGN